MNNITTLPVVHLYFYFTYGLSRIITRDAPEAKYPNKKSLNHINLQCFSMNSLPLFCYGTSDNCSYRGCNFHSFSLQLVCT